MINNVGSNSAAVQPPSTPSAQTPTTYQTPFVDVLVSQLTEPDLAALFATGDSADRMPSNVTTATPAAQPAAADAAAQPNTDPTVGSVETAPTAQSVFGANPWVTDPTGSVGNITWNYNPIYFATPQTAAKVAGMVGGTVIQENAMTPNGGLNQSVPNEMVQLPDGGIINPGLVADFWDHGYQQSNIDQMIQNEVKGA